MDSKPGLIYFTQTVHHCRGKNLSSTERADLDDDLCRPLFVLCLLAIFFSVLPRYMNSDFLFVIFKLVFNIKSKELVDQV